MISFPKSMFDSETSRVFFVSTDRLVAYHWHKNNIDRSYLFDLSVEGFNCFERYLSEVEKYPVYILLDTAAEEYRIANIPHVFGSDRQSVIVRKQDRIFRGASHFYTEIQGREESGRRDDKIMISAITGDAVIKPWLSRMDTHKIPLIGIVSVPLLIQGVKDILPDLQENSLVLSLQSTSGLRQSFFNRGFLKFSRLVKVPRYGTGSYAWLIESELIKIRYYIQNARLATEDKPMDIYLFGNRELLQELGERHTDAPTIRYHLLNIATLSEACGLSAQGQHPFSDQYLVYQLLKNKSRNYYATGKEMRYFRMRQVKKLLRAANCMLVLLVIACSGWNMLESFFYHQQQLEEAQKVDFYSAQYAVEKQRIPVLAVDSAELKVAVDAHKVLTRYKSDPIAMFQLISTDLEAFPELKIKQIKWSVDTDINVALQTSEGDATTTTDLKDPHNFNNIDHEGISYLYYQTAMLNGYLPGFDGDYRKALSMIEEFVATIGQQSDAYVSIESLPVDVSSGASLHGSTEESPTQADFSVRVVLGIRDEA